MLTVNAQDLSCDDHRRPQSDSSSYRKRIGILEDISQACEGSEIDKLSDEELNSFVENIRVYARVTPEHKIRIVRAWQERGNIVAMTGEWCWMMHLLLSRRM